MSVAKKTLDNVDIARITREMFLESPLKKAASVFLLATPDQNIDWCLKFKDSLLKLDSEKISLTHKVWSFDIYVICKYLKTLEYCVLTSLNSQDNLVVLYSGWQYKHNAESNSNPYFVNFVSVGQMKWETVNS